MGSLSGVSKHVFRLSRKCLSTQHMCTHKNNSAIFQTCPLLPITANILLAPQRQVPSLLQGCHHFFKAFHASVQLRLTPHSLQCTLLLCSLPYHTVQQVLNLTLKFNAILIPANLCLASSPHRPSFSPAAQLDQLSSRIPHTG